MKIRKAIRFLKFLEQDEKFLKKKFLKKEAVGSGGGASASVASLGKTPSPAIGVASEPGNSYALPKRKKKKGYERS